MTEPNTTPGLLAGTFAGLGRLVASPANWCGMGLASGVLLLQGAGWLGSGPLGLVLAGLGYGAGFAVGGLWLGFPSLRDDGFDWTPLQFSDDGDTRAAMTQALTGVRRLVEQNPGRRIPAPLQQRVRELCDALDGLLRQWEHSRGTLSLQDSFDARHIAIKHLPEMLNTYLSIPAGFAANRTLDNGRTAVEIFGTTLTELEKKVRQLGDDLAAQDAQAFLIHSQFLNQKFAARGLDAPGLNLPSQASRPTKEDRS